MEMVHMPGGGEHWPRKGYWDVRPWRTPFHASPAVSKGPISSKRVSSQDPLLRKLGNFSLYSLNFHPNFSLQAPNLKIFSSQAPKLGNFQFTSPQLWKFSVHKPPPFSEASISSQAPHFGNPGRTWHTLPEKKLSAPPPGTHVMCTISMIRTRLMRTEILVHTLYYHSKPHFNTCNQCWLLMIIMWSILHIPDLEISQVLDS